MIDGDAASKTKGRGRDIACSVTLGFLLAATYAGSMAAGGVLKIPALAESPNLKLAIASAALAVFAAATIACYTLLRTSSRFLVWADGKNPLGKITLTFDKKSAVVAAIVILVCWSPLIILQYPTAMNGDTYNQLYQFQTSSPTLYSTLGTTVGESYIDHHPVFDTLLFGAFLSLGDLVGSQNAGLFAYTLFQSALSATGLALTCCYLDRLNVPKPFRLASLAFCALFTPLGMWAATMEKDALYAAVFIYFSLLVAEAVRTRGGMFDSKAAVIAYIVVGCLCILTKKSGVIVFGVSTLALMLYLHSRWIELVSGLAIPLAVCFALVPAVVYPAIGGVAPGGKQEAFGFALQQVITAMNDEGDLADWEREALDGVLDVDRAKEQYKPTIVDPVKNSVKTDATTADYLHFIPAYFSIGLRHPLAYTASALRIAGTLIAPGRTFTFHNTPEQKDSWVAAFQAADSKGELHLTFHKPDLIASWMKQFDETWKQIVPELGPFGIFFSTGFYGGWIPLICLTVCLFHDRRFAVALVPMCATVAMIVIGPASSVRYMIPLAYTTPLMLGLLCTSLETRLARGDRGEQQPATT